MKKRASRKSRIVAEIPAVNTLGQQYAYLLLLRDEVGRLAAFQLIACRLELRSCDASAAQSVPNFGSLWCVAICDIHAASSIALISSYLS